jgi:hypothetical protein
VESYLARRRKEEQSFLVVRFLRVYELFEGVYRDFRAVSSGGRGFGGSGLFQRVKEMEEKLVFDIKEKAHFLFRGPTPAGWGEAVGSRSRPTMSALGRSLVDRALDSTIGTGFHMFMILRECLYQLEVYTPRYGAELEQVERLEELARRLGTGLGEEEDHELEQLRQIVKHGQGLSGYTRELAEQALERCRALFQQAAELMRHFIESAGRNEVLVLNLLREREAVDRVYGEGGAERLFSHMFRKSGKPGASGLDKALAYARRHCGNTEALRG